MEADGSDVAFRNHLGTVGLELEALTPRTALNAAIAFYADVRAEGCSGDDADMLLFEWGVYNWGNGEVFELGFTRQFIAGEPEDDNMSQLHLTLLYPSSPGLVALGRGSHWCRSTDLAAEMEAYIVSSEAYKTVDAHPPASVSLWYDHV